MVLAVLLSGILQGILLIFLLYQKGYNKIPNRILSFLILVVIAHLSLIAIDVQELFIRYPHLSRLSWLLPLFYGPVILLFTKSIIEINFSFKARQALYLLPFLTYLVLLTPYYILSSNEKIAYLSDHEKVTKADFGWMNYFTNYIHLSFVTFALFVYYSGRQKLPQYFSDKARTSIPWLGKFLWGIVGIMLFSLFTFYAKKYQLRYFSGIYPNHFLLVVVLIYWIAYKLLQEKTIFFNSESIPQTEIEPEATPVKYSKTGLDIETSKLNAEKLRHLMEVKRPYLNPELTISDLSDMLLLTRHQLSQVINSEFGVNFYEFVNNYRVVEFKKQALSPSNSHLSLLGIAFECGFNSKATFNQVFKKQEGITPSEFVRKNKTEKTL